MTLIEHLFARNGLPGGARHYHGGVAPTRYRCAACGNLTRFDVTTTSRTRAYHHYSLSGDLSVEDPEVLSEVVESVSCRWCGSGRAVEVLPDAGPPAGATEAHASPGPPPEQPGG
jgi:hypothetical protein